MEEIASPPSAVRNDKKGTTLGRPLLTIIIEQMC